MVAIIFGVLLLLAIYILWVLFVDGWLFKIILFFAGWIGLFVLMRIYVEGSTNVAVVIGGTGFTWSAVVPTIICFLALLTAKVRE